MATDKLRDTAFEIIGICSTVPNGVDGEARRVTDVIRMIKKKLEIAVGVMPPTKEGQEK